MRPTDDLDESSATVDDQTIFFFHEQKCRFFARALKTQVTITFCVRRTKWRRNRSVRRDPGNGGRGSTVFKTYKFISGWQTISLSTIRSTAICDSAPGRTHTFARVYNCSAEVFRIETLCVLLSTSYSRQGGRKNVLAAGTVVPRSSASCRRRSNDERN